MFGLATTVHELIKSIDSLTCYVVAISCKAEEDKMAKRYVQQYSSPTSNPIMECLANNKKMNAR